MCLYNGQTFFNPFIFNSIQGWARKKIRGGINHRCFANCALRQAAPVVAVAPLWIEFGLKKCTGTSDKLRRIDDTSPNSGRKIYYALLLAASLKSALILFFCLQVSLITIHDGFKRWYTFTTRFRFIMVESVLYVLLANDILMLNFFPVMLWVLKI